MRLLFSFGGHFSAVGYGGGHQVLRGLARALARLGHEVRVVVAAADEIGAAAIDSQVSYQFRPRGAPQAGVVRLALATIGAVREWQPDAVCCFTEEIFLVAPVCRARQVPVFARLDAPELFEMSLSRTGLRNARWHSGQVLLRLGCKLATSTLTVSEHTRRQAIEVWGLSPDRVITSGIGLDEAYCAGSSRVAYVPGEPLRLLSVGRISLGQKPLDSVAAALSRTKVPWAHWTIVGSGEHDAVLGACIHDLGLTDRVRMMGFMPPIAVAKELATHDVVLLPSRYESFFLTPYEAIAGGCLVITNDVAEVKRLLGPTRRLVLARDQSATSYQDALTDAWTWLQQPTRQGPDPSNHVRATYSWDAAGVRFLSIAQNAVSDKT